MVYICVFCGTLYSSGATICNDCHDYKGIMPLADAMTTYDFIKDPADD